MCTIGVVNSNLTTKIYFKNLDQVAVSYYAPPQILRGKRFRYLKLPMGVSPREPGTWAGVNEKGLVVLGADGNAQYEFSSGRYGDLSDGFRVYEKVLSECGDMRGAMDLLIHEYQENRYGGVGDIVLLGDSHGSVILEYIPDRWGLQFLGRENYMLRTNFFVLLANHRPPPELNSLHASSAVRYTTALQHLSVRGAENDVENVMELLRSHAYGHSAMSICRHGGSGEYSTRCSFITEVSRTHVRAYVLINGNPCRKNYVEFCFD